ncbi:type II secretion system protein GspM [Chitinibacter sp. FCG-7]|uniref:Type II secretion system protein GspM n=1 Tax=Chitinibacter mangrovi TaxID=3153927 RepID=A0AAU7F479_9NEIS
MSHPLIVKAQNYWQARSPRERRVLQIWLLLVASAAIYWGLYSPLSAEITRLQRAVPTLENQLITMRGSKTEVAVLQPSAAQQDLRTAAFAAISSKQLSADIRSITPTQLELRASLPTVNEALNLAHSLRNELAAKISAIQIKSDAQGTALLIILERS